MNGRRRSGWVRRYTKPSQVVENRLARVAPGVVEVGLERRFREVGKRFPVRLGQGGLAQMGGRQIGGFGGKIVFRIGRRVVDLVAEITQRLALVLLQQAVVIVLRMALEIHDTEPVGAHRHVHARLVAVHQHPQTGGRQLLLRYLIPARVRHVETRIDALQQRMGAIAHPMAVHPPLLARQWVAVNLIQLLDQRVRGEARAQDARHVVRRPVG